MTDDIEQVYEASERQILERLRVVDLLDGPRQAL